MQLNQPAFFALSYLFSSADVQFEKKQKFQASFFALERQGLQWNPETEIQ